MKIKLKKISLNNFKGIKNLEVNFADTTIISGKNGSGKSSIFDAFTWLLFGKNSQDRKVFNIKTLDENGKEIPKLEHSVEAVLDIDGSELCLKKTLSEKWVRKRGETEATFQGNTEEVFIDGIKVKPIDFSVKVTSICSENIFKTITSPYFFTAKKWEEQRKDLLNMVKDIAIEYPENFKTIIDKLSEKGISIDDAKKNVQQVKKSLNAKIATIPAKIEEVQGQLKEYEKYNFDDEEKELHDAEEKLKTLEAQSAGIINKEAVEEINSLERQRSDISYKINLVFNELKTKKLEECNAIANKNKQIEYQISSNEDKIIHLETEIKQDERIIAQQSELKSRLIANWKEHKAAVFELDTDALKCPTCGREYDFDKIEEIKENALAHFNKVKAEGLRQIEEAGSEANKIIADTQTLVENSKKEIEELKAENIRLKEQFIPNESWNGIVEDDERIKELNDKMSALTSQIEEKKKALEDIKPVDTTAERQRLQDQIKFESTILGYKEISLKLKSRIADLEIELREKSQMMAEVEGKEFQLSEISKFRINALEDAINSKFDLVKFKLFKQQINGEVIECCEAMVNGVPYSDVNTAGKINAGLDIIKTICAENQTYAPIFIDNAEAINEILPTCSQQIHLVVSNNSLTIN